MAGAPDLSPEATSLLKTLDSASRARRDYLRGGEVMKMTGLPRAKFVALVEELAQKDLISVDGPRTVDDIDFAVLSVHPTNRGFVRAL